MSKNVYQLELRAVCPIHSHLVDVYQLTIHTEATIQVEKILSVISQYETRQIFQEAMTDELAVTLGAHVETIGVHAGVKVTCTAP